MTAPTRIIYKMKFKKLILYLPAGQTDINTIEPFSPYQEKTCFPSCIQHVLQVPITEDMPQETGNSLYIQHLNRQWRLQCALISEQDKEESFKKRDKKKKKKKNSCKKCMKVIATEEPGAKPQHKHF